MVKCNVLNAIKQGRELIEKAADTYLEGIDEKLFKIITGEGNDGI